MPESGSAGTVQWSALFARVDDYNLSLQGRIRKMLVSAILSGHLPPGSPVPSSRELAKALGVARNTTVFAYQQLVVEGYLESRERSGHYVAKGMANQQAAPQGAPAAGPPPRTGVDWSRRLVFHPFSQRNIVKPANWQSLPYPFSYAQFDAQQFPTAEWRECCLRALSVLDIRMWAPDLIASDGKTAVQWPPDIPRPTADRAYLRDDQEQVPFDLTLMAVAYVFLHELRHVILDHDDVHASSAAEEEIACDVWARGMLLDKLANYAQKHGLSYEAVLNKRATAMALACLMLQTITPHWAQWGNDDYPSVGERMAALIKDVTLSSGSGFWIVAASVLVGVMRETHQSIEVVPSSVAELVNDLIERRR